MERTTNILHNAVFNPNYDIVWSFKFLLSSPSVNALEQGGFVTYLAKPRTEVAYNVGEGYAHLGYDALSAASGIQGAVLGIGFDTLGIFAASGVGLRANGIPLSSIKSNSITIRGGYSAYNLLYTESLSALNTEMTLLTNTEDYQWLRFRLGNIGRTLYIDYRRYDTDSYTQILEYPVSLPFTETSLYCVGVSYTYPVSFNYYVDHSDTVLRIKNLQVEGYSNTPDTYVFTTTSSAITAFELQNTTIVDPITSDVLSIDDDYIFLA